MIHSNPGPRRGISRLDIIIILAILGLLSQFALPAIQAGRESARSYQCRSNLRNLTTALLNYHEQFNVFPPAGTWNSADVDVAAMNAFDVSTPLHVTEQSWIQHLLPQLGETDLANQFAPGTRIADEKNRVARQTSVASLSCPADPYNRRDNLYKMPLPDETYVEFARGNYAMNGGSEFVPAAFGTLSNPGPTLTRYEFDEKARTFSYLGSGIGGINISVGLRDIDNGTSTTVALEEIRAGLDPIDTRGVWSLGQVGASITWGHGVLGDAGSPNASRVDESADDIRFGKELYEKLGREFIDGERMQACDHCDDNDQATARSKHAGGVNLATLDGAVHFVSDNIEPTLWHVMHSRRTPAQLLASHFKEELSGGNQKTEPSKEPAATKPVARGIPASLENSLGIKFIRIPAGEFTMGLPDAGNRLPFPPDVIPHQVRMTQDFLIGIHEVTQSQYQQVMLNNPSWYSPSGGGRDLVAAAETMAWPVENVSWDDAVEFCHRLSELPSEKKAKRTYRLPTEAEWEYTCRGGIAGEIARPTWSDAVETGQTASNKIPKGTTLLPKPVGSFPPNPFGVYDMCGNVYEWTADYRRYGYYQNSPLEDPKGPSTGYLHVIRGWNWVATGPACKVYVANEPWTGSRFIGFRMICSIESD